MQTIGLIIWNYPSETLFRSQLVGFLQGTDRRPYEHQIRFDLDSQAINEAEGA
jgi:hypothetical protein